MMSPPLTPEQKQAEAAKLNDLQRKVTLKAGTEPAFTGKTVNGYSHDNKKKGMYVSAVGGLPLFSSDTKFDSGKHLQLQRSYMLGIWAEAPHWRLMYRFPAPWNFMHLP